MVAPFGDRIFGEQVVTEPEETVDVSWFRAFSDNEGGPIFAEARFRVNGGEWVTKKIEGIEEYETCTYFPLTARIGFQTNGKWRKPPSPIVDDRISHVTDFDFGNVGHLGGPASSDQDGGSHRFTG